MPGGLAPSDVPQFVVLTNDDAITVTSKPTILDITNAYTNRKNGCNIPFTCVAARPPYCPKLPPSFLWPCS